MKRFSLHAAFLIGSCCLATAASTDVLRLHPDNPHYFLWRGKPTALITSGEHYGAVLNLDFDYVKYLDTLAADHLTLTRTFTGGAYYEPQGAFNIARNTLAPDPSRFISPWARADGKFDLSRWNPDYFQRLRDFVRQADRRNVVVELNLFCPFYEEAQWKLSPFNAANNINKVGQTPRTNVYTLDKHGGLLPFQENMTRKMVEELQEFGNVYYEICNEPYFGGVTVEWQHHIAEIIAAAQANHPHPKLISRNVANKSATITNPHPALSIYNFHYASPPDAVGVNYALNKVIGDNETGFRGTNDAPYRTEAWEFILAGGGLYNNLDYSFVAGHEDGTFVYPSSQPGGGNPVFRKQLRTLSDFIHSFDLPKLKPDALVIAKTSPGNRITRVLSDPGRAYAIYTRSGAPKQPPEPLVLDLKLPPGRYAAEWIDCLTGKSVRREEFEHESGVRSLPGPSDPLDELALRIVRRD